jgi:predicted lipoprotein with Yx(FWY)xxD motif
MVDEMEGVAKKIHPVVRSPAVVLVLALLAGACGHKHPPPPKTGTPQSVTIRTGNVLGVGTVLVNGPGWTVYSLLSLRAQKPVPCTSSACTKKWPPLLLPKGVSAPKARPGAKASLLGTTKVPAGIQVTYRGQPLYVYSGDKGPHQCLGRGIASFGGAWHMLLASGEPMPLLVG